jgi:hypothetical protein
MDLKARVKFSANAFRLPDNGKVAYRIDLPEGFFAPFPSAEHRGDALAAVKRHFADLGFDESTPIAFWLPEHLRQPRSGEQGGTTSDILPTVGIAGIASAAARSQGESDICVDRPQSRRKVVRLGFLGTALAALALFSPFGQRAALAGCGDCNTCRCAYCYKGTWYREYFKCTVGAPGENCGYCRNPFCYVTDFNRC